MLRDADTAMYRAKSQGSARYEMFDSAMHARAVSLLQLENELRQAIEREEFARALPADRRRSPRAASPASRRWCAGSIRRAASCGPLDFIPVAEDTGIIIQIGRWVLQQACRAGPRVAGAVPDGERSP